MNDKWHTSQGGIATARKPRLLIAGGIHLACKAADHFRMLGWEVLNVSAGDAMSAALSRKTTAILLPTETDLESGYLLAAKMRETRKKLKVVLVGTDRTPKLERFAAFVGAAYVAEADGVRKLTAAVFG
jgi:DNA-binding response OmpR family regulator